MLVDNPHMRSPTRRTWRPREAVGFIEGLAARPGPPERRHTRSDRRVGSRGPPARSPAPLTGVAPFYSGLTRTDRAFSCTDEIVKTLFLSRLSCKLLADLAQADEGVRSVRRIKFGAAFVEPGKRMLLLLD